MSRLIGDLRVRMHDMWLGRCVCTPNITHRVPFIELFICSHIGSPGISSPEVRFPDGTDKKCTV